MNHDLFRDFVVILLHTFCQKRVLFDDVSQLLFVVRLDSFHHVWYTEDFDASNQSINFDDVK
jgi:hypothetical protein